MSRHYARFFRKKGARFFIDAARGGLWLGALLGAVVIMEKHPAYAAIVMAAMWTSWTLKASADEIAKAMKSKQGNTFKVEKLVVEAGEVADLMKLTASSVSLARAMKDVK
jgi:hypothetical protein